MTKKTDARYFQMLFLLSFLVYGLLYLHWQSRLPLYGVFVGTCLALQWMADSLVSKRWLKPGPKWTGWRSALVTALGLCFLLRTNDWYIGVLAAALSILSKYLLRLRGKHIFNPSAFGIVATILITGDAWISPGQWGNPVLLVFLVCALGCIVVTRVQKLDTSLAFLVTFCGLLFVRQVGYLHWPTDFFVQSISSGSLLIFSFFMISDPKTTPDHPYARIAWAAGIALIAFFLSAIEWMNNTPIWTLVAIAPLVPLIDLLFRGKKFDWQPRHTQPLIHKQNV